MSTIDQVIAKARRRFPNLAPTRAQELFMDILRELYFRAEVRAAPIDITLTAGVREYSLAQTFGIYAVYYLRSAADSDAIVLQPVDTGLLDARDSGWRDRLQQGEPQEYYVSSAASADSAQNVIGFLPLPPLTTSGGYPIARVYCSQSADLSASETVPSNVIGDNLFVFGIRYLHALDRGLDEAAGPYKSLYEEELRKNVLFIKGQQTRESTQLIPAVGLLNTPTV